MGAFPQRGFTVWLTGLPGSGKTTLAELLAESLREGLGGRIELLDGDVVRTHLSRGLGFSKEDRDTHIRRIGWVCRLLTKHGIANIAAAISPYRDVRDEIRLMIEQAGGKGSFVEVYAKCPLEVCERRDEKGFYKKARSGEIKDFTGITDPYEPPLQPEIIVETDRESPKESATRILDHLRSSKRI